MDDIRKVFDIVDCLADEYCRFFKDIVLQQTYSTDKPAIDVLCRFIKDFAEKKGFIAEIEPFKVAGDGLLVTMNPDASLPPVVFVGHYDTVHPAGTFADPVFHIEGDKAYGPGVLDMKGGLVIGLLAMEALSRAGYEDRMIKFIFIPDEERSEGLSGEAGKEFIRSNSRGAAIALTLEGSCKHDKIIVARKGSIRYQVTVRGRSAHAGSNYAYGRSAIKDAAHKILDIEAKSVPDQITYNCGMVRGGTSPNTVPEFCEFMLYNRYWTSKQHDEIKSHVEGILERQYIPDTKTEYEIIGERPPMEGTPGNYALFDFINKTAIKYGFGHFHPIKENSGSDATYTTQVGVPSVCAMGPVGYGAHQLDECCFVDSIYTRAKLIAAVVAELPADFG
ncbi:MAG: M20/M25/M40 family metallo-hydrolase [Sphaerochaetaceae bacterium]